MTRKTKRNWRDMQPIGGRLCAAGLCLALALGAVGVSSGLAASAGTAGEDGVATSHDAVGNGADTEGAAKEERVAWSTGQDCLDCHTKIEKSAEDTGCLAGFHSKTLGVACVDCHDDGAVLSPLHENAKADAKQPKRLKKTEVTAQACTTCHDEEKLVEATKGCRYLTDKNGLTVNPHAVPQNDGHAELSCVDCHEAHDEGGLAPEEEATLGLCTSCHHREVFECGTCHD